MNKETRTPVDRGLGQPLVRFAFDGQFGQVLRKHYERDVAAAKLSLKFRLYYHLRPWLGRSLRQALQRGRNQALSVPSDWFIPQALWEDVQAALPTMDGTVVHPWPDGRRYALALTHDIEGAEGWSRVRELADIEESFGLRSAWYVVPHLYKVDHALLDELRERGHEVGVHGYNHDGRLFLSRRLFKGRLPAINAAAKEFRACGFRAPMVHRNLTWMQELDFDYDASCFDIDPFQPMPGGVGGVWPFTVGKLVELPYTLPQDHTLMVTLGKPAYETWLKKLTWIKRLSGLALLITHPDYLTTFDRIVQYRRFCEYVAQDQEKWVALPREVTSWWRQRQATVIGSDGRLHGPAEERGRIARLRDLFDA